MRFALEATCLVSLLALVACGNDAMVDTPPVTEQPPAAGGGGTPTPPAAGQGTGASGSGSAGRAGSPTTGSAADSGGSGTAGTPPAAGTSAAGSGAAGVTGTAGTPAAGSGGATAGASGAGAAGMAGTAGTPGTGLGDSDTLVPHTSWDCAMPGGIPGPATGELAFEVTFQLGEVHDLGTTQYGKRLLIELKGGTLKGPEIEASVMDRGLDWQLTLPNGAIEVEQVTFLRTSDGANIYFRNCGTAASESGDVRIVPDFEAPNSSRHAWLNTTKLAGTRTFDRTAKTMTMKVYKYAESAAPAGNTVQVEQPADLPDQTWECKEPTGTRGSVMYTESVGIGGSVSVGASKRGSRNIIPITGGTTSGRIQGGILSGGADFQLSAGGEFILDARYTLKTNDDHLILVRNCGPIGALVPVFEASSDGPYAWVNEGDWLSSDPGISIGAVNLTIYEAN